MDGRPKFVTADRSVAAGLFPSRSACSRQEVHSRNVKSNRIQVGHPAEMLGSIQEPAAFERTFDDQAWLCYRAATTNCSQGTRRSAWHTRSRRSCPTKRSMRSCTRRSWQQLGSRLTLPTSPAPQPLTLRQILESTSPPCGSGQQPATAART